MNRPYVSNVLNTALWPGAKDIENKVESERRSAPMMLRSELRVLSKQALKANADNNNGIANLTLIA
ncbi:MAG: hypothetical protein EAS52_10015 [Parapedobacter sp.]|nr:MAG: hypothetical protein EAS52_10015 [Parapedobacter sp.]